MERMQGFLGAIMWQLMGSDESGPNGRKEQGQTMVEYGLIIALVSIVAIATLGLVGSNIKDVFTSIAGKLHS